MWKATDLPFSLSSSMSISVGTRTVNSAFEGFFMDFLLYALVDLLFRDAIIAALLCLGSIGGARKSLLS